MDKLILTGYGWTDYAVAAAVALKGLGGLADVAGVSKRRLPEMLEAPAKGVRNIYILGVALGGDEERLASENARQKAVAAVKARFGANAVFSGTDLLPEATGLERNRQIGGHKSGV